MSAPILKRSDVRLFIKFTNEHQEQPDARNADAEPFGYEEKRLHSRIFLRLKFFFKKNLYLLTPNVQISSLF